MRSPRLLQGLLLVVVLIGLVGLGLWVGSDDDAATDQRPGSAARSSAPTPRSTTPRSTAPRSTAPAGDRDPESGLPWADLVTLPREAQQTVSVIERGGPYPYGKDGATFGNRERILPRRPAGYYREYTVATPGEDDRGARRIVTGDDDRQFFYTGDHYGSFVRVRA